MKKHRSLCIALSLFIVGATINIFNSIDMRSALGEWKAFYIEPIILFIILITSIKDKKTIHIILNALVFCGLATTLLSIYQHFTGWMVPWEYWGNKDTFRVTGWYGFPNGVGLFLAPLVPLAIHLFLNNWKNLKSNPNITTYLNSFLTGLFIITAPLAIFYAKSTGGLVGITAGIGILLLLWKKTRKLVLIFGILSLLVFVFTPQNPIKQELLMQDRSGQLRLNMWAETIEFLGDHPLTGAGLASYKTLIYPYRIDKWIEVFHHPHNIFLTMWVNIGLIGLFGFTWIVVWFFRVAIQNLKSNSLILFLLSSMIVFMTTGLVDSPYIKNDMAILFWTLPALLISTIEMKKTS